MEEEGPGSRFEQNGRLEGKGVIEAGGTGVRCFDYAQEEEPASDLFPSVQKKRQEKEWTPGTLVCLVCLGLCSRTCTSTVGPKGTLLCRVLDIHSFDL